MKREFIGTVGHDFNDWFFETNEQSYSADVVTALDDLIGETSVGDKYKITIEKLSKNHSFIERGEM